MLAARLILGFAILNLTFLLLDIVFNTLHSVIF